MTRGDALTRLYADTSAFIKIIIQEAESENLTRYLDETYSVGDEVIISRLTFAELFCVLKRSYSHIDWSESVDLALSNVDVYPIEDRDFTVAADSNWRLRGADAIHLAAAKRLRCDTMVVFDKELADAAKSEGLKVPEF